MPGGQIERLSKVARDFPRRIEWMLGCCATEGARKARLSGMGLPAADSPGVDSADASGPGGVISLPCSSDGQPSGGCLAAVSDDSVCANRVWLGLGFHFVAEELRDGAEFEVDEHDGDEDLAGGEASHPSTSGGGDKLLAIVLEAAVLGLDLLAGVVVELIPFRTHERERLLLPQGVFLGEGDRMLLTDPVEELGEVALFEQRFCSRL